MQIYESKEKKKVNNLLDEIVERKWVKNLQIRAWSWVVEEKSAETYGSLSLSLKLWKGVKCADEKDDERSSGELNGCDL